MINRTSQNWPEGTAIEITNQSQGETMTTEEILLAALEAISKRDPFVENYCDKGTQPCDCVGCVARAAIVRAIEQRPMSEWTQYEMDTYNRITNQEKN